MTDREMLLLSYGAIKTASSNSSGLKSVVEMLEEHLWPALKTPAPSELAQMLKITKSDIENL